MPEEQGLITHPDARGEHFLAVAGSHMPMQEMAKLLKARMGAAARRVPTGVLPDWMIKLGALFDPAVAQIVPELGQFTNASHEKAGRVLGWTPRSNEDAILATADSLVRLGLLRN